jgi:hypothetical protein
MSTLKIGRSHKARKALFARGIRRGFLSVEEIDDALPPGSLTDAERWLLYYSLKASRVEVRDGDGNSVEVEERPAETRRRSMSDEAADEIGFEADTQH